MTVSTSVPRASHNSARRTLGAVAGDRVRRAGLSDEESRLRRAARSVGSDSSRATSFGRAVSAVSNILLSWSSPARARSYPASSSEPSTARDIATMKVPSMIATSAPKKIGSRHRSESARRRFLRPVSMCASARRDDTSSVDSMIFSWRRCRVVQRRHNVVV